MLTLDISYYTSNEIGGDFPAVRWTFTPARVNFNDVSGEDLPVQKLFPYSEGMTAGKTEDFADNIQVMKDDDSMDYETYFVWNGKSGKGEGSVKNPEDVGKWSKAGDTSATTANFPVGRGAWFQSRGKTGSLKFINPVAK